MIDTVRKEPLSPAEQRLRKALWDRPALAALLHGGPIKPPAWVREIPMVGQLPSPRRS